MSCPFFGILHQKILKVPGAKKAILKGTGSPLPQLCHHLSLKSLPPHRFSIPCSIFSCICASRSPRRLTLRLTDCPPGCVSAPKKLKNCQKFICSPPTLCNNAAAALLGSVSPPELAISSTALLILPTKLDVLACKSEA